MHLAVCEQCFEQSVCSLPLPSAVEEFLSNSIVCEIYEVSESKLGSFKLVYIGTFADRAQRFGSNLFSHTYWRPSNVLCSTVNFCCYFVVILADACSYVPC